MPVRSVRKPLAFARHGRRDDRSIPSLLLQDMPKGQRHGKNEAEACSFDATTVVSSAMLLRAVMIHVLDISHNAREEALCFTEFITLPLKAFSATRAKRSL
jgi:hypothetical protein